MKASLLLSICILFSFLLQAQSPVGKWKFVSYTQETRDGKKTDLLKDFTKEYPCTATLVMIFTADGKITDQGGKCPASIQQAGLGAKWKMPAKNKISILSDDDDIDPVTYNFEITGNKMRWTIIYEPDEASPVKQLVAEFVKS